MKAVRTLLIRRKLSELGLTQEEIEHIKRLSTRLDALGNLYARGYAVEPPDIPRKFIGIFKYFRDSLIFGNGKPLPKAWFVRVHAVGDVRVRTSNKEDHGEKVFIDLPRGILRVRGFFYRRAIEVRLNESEARYIWERLNEGGKTKFVQLWVDERDRLNVAIAFERKVTPTQPSDYSLVVDVNSWRYGVWWWLVKGDEVVSRGVVRPSLRFIDTTYGRTTMLERKLGKLKRLGLDETLEGRRIRREIRNLKRKLYAYLRDFVNKSVHALIRKAVRRGAKIVIDYVIEESRRELLEEGLSNSLVKLYLAYLPRFVKLLETQARWYGIPIEFKRLPSTVCPVCGGKLRHVGGRTMACDRCGFKANRDEIPIMWYIKENKTKRIIHDALTTTERMIGAQVEGKRSNMAP